MKRDDLQHLSLNDRKLRQLVSQMIRRSGDKIADTIAWYDSLDSDDKKLLIAGMQIALKEMVDSTRTLSASMSPLLAVMMRDVEGNEHD